MPEARPGPIIKGLGRAFSGRATPLYPAAVKGLRASGCPFLWIVCDQDWLAKEDFGGKGLVVPWCGHMNVLSHPSVGGFHHRGHIYQPALPHFPHCGRPKLQQQDDMKMVGNEKIAAMVWKVMNLERKKNKEMRRREESSKAA
ncbi:UDP-glycosyltransferase [Nymphaea thermarum]|nr:UDP-glycosyltransferase [Nymphaea thermarum]